MAAAIIMWVVVICVAKQVCFGDTFVITHYDNCKLCCGKEIGQPAYGITASGKRASTGTIAVDPKIIPLGSLVEIEGLGVFRAEDTGGAIKGKRIDIWCRNHQIAQHLGVKKLNVKIVKFTTTQTVKQAQKL